MGGAEGRRARVCMCGGGMLILARSITRVPLCLSMVSPYHIVLQCVSACSLHSSEEGNHDLPPTRPHNLFVDHLETLLSCQGLANMDSDEYRKRGGKTFFAEIHTHTHAFTHASIYSSLLSEV